MVLREMRLTAVLEQKSRKSLGAKNTPLYLQVRILQPPKLRFSTWAYAYLKSISRFCWGRFPCCTRNWQLLRYSRVWEDTSGSKTLNRTDSELEKKRDSQYYLFYTPRIFLPRGRLLFTACTSISPGRFPRRISPPLPSALLAACTTRSCQSVQYIFPPKSVNPYGCGAFVTSARRPFPSKSHVSIFSVRASAQ